MSDEQAAMRRVTEVLIRHGHYRNQYGQPDESPDSIQWMVVDAQAVLAEPVTYDAIAAALLDTGCHDPDDPDDCNVLCVTELVEALS